MIRLFIWKFMMKLNHVALTVSDRERSAEFYGKWFGFNLRVHEDEHILILRNEHGDFFCSKRWRDSISASANNTLWIGGKIYAGGRRYASKVC